MSKRPSEPGSGPSLKLVKMETANGVKEEDGSGAGAPEQKPPRHELLTQGMCYPTVTYKEGEPLTGLQQIYDASTGDDKIAEVIIPAEYMNSNTNKGVKTRQLWGNLIYTGDSDIVAALMHMSFVAHYLSHPPSQVQEFRALLRLLPPQANYPSKARFVKSRSWCSSIQGFSYQVECCWLITRAGVCIDLQPCLDEVPAPYPTVQAHLNRQMLTRSTGRQVVKVGQEVSVQFNLCNEPWLKYTMAAIADRGTKPGQWTSSRLLDDVLLFETMSTRYQIARTGDLSQGGQSKDIYSLSKCKTPLTMEAMRRVSVPLPTDQVEVLELDVGWEEFKWGVATLNVRSREIPIKRIHFAPISKLRDQAGES